jgi:Gamma-glutamyl phosphate reductase
MEQIADNVKQLRKSAMLLSSSSDEERRGLLIRLASALEADKEYLFSENAKDVGEAKKAGIKDSVLHRLVFTPSKLASALEGLRQLASLPDPIGRIKEKRLLDEGLVLEKVSVPIGVIGMIFEARPDAMIQIIGLALRTGNGIILKGGKEARHSNEAIYATVKKALDGAPYVMLLSTHSDVDAILKMEKDIDLLIPRGSNAFVRHVMDNTHIPVLGHADGICAVYVDKSADLDKAVRVVFDSKTQYPAACNAAETLLVHSSVAKEFLPLMKTVFDNAGVEIRGDERTRHSLMSNRQPKKIFTRSFSI